MRFVKIGIEKTTRTDLVCIACGKFHTEFAILHARSLGGDDASEAGLHRACIEDVHQKKGGST